MQAKILCCLPVMFLLLTVAPARAGYEKPPVLQAKSVLKPELLKGKYHTVDNQVKNDGLFNHYTVRSKFGIFHPGSSMDLQVLVHELAAIASLTKLIIEFSNPV